MKPCWILVLASIAGLSSATFALARETDPDPCGAPTWVLAGDREYHEMVGHNKPPSGTLTVPITIRYLKLPEDPSAGDSTDIEKKFSKERLKALFAPAASQPSAEENVNTIWNQAQLFFRLDSLHECKFTESDYPGSLGDREWYHFPTADDVPWAVMPPIPGTKMGLFRWIAGHLGNRSAGGSYWHGITLFLIWQIGHESQTYDGFGAPDFDEEPTRPNENPDNPYGGGAVWVSSTCLTGIGPNDPFTPALKQGCARQVAHEIGHFLGLCHPCGLMGVDPEAPPPDADHPSNRGIDCNRHYEACTCERPAPNRCIINREKRAWCGARADYTRGSCFFAYPGSEMLPCQKNDLRKAFVMWPGQKDRGMGLDRCAAAQAYRRALRYAVGWGGDPDVAGHLEYPSLRECGPGGKAARALHSLQP